jgi:hypothetical protein
MPMNHSERDEILAEIGIILQEDIHGQLMDFYAAAVSLNEKQPEQVNNELRNAITHFARAISEETKQHADEQILKARSHIDRAKRDAIKLSLIALRDRIARICGEIKLINGSIDSAFVLRRDGLTARRREALRKEINGDSDVLEHFIRLFNDADQLELDLLNTFNITENRIPKWKFWILALRKQAFGVLGGILIGILAAAIFAVAAPDATGFGWSVRKVLNLPSEHQKTAAPPPVGTRDHTAKPACTKANTTDTCSTE